MAERINSLELSRVSARPMERRSEWITKARSRKTARPRKPFNGARSVRPSAPSLAQSLVAAKGAAIGAAIGAGGGAGTVIVQGRDQLDLPRGTELTIASSVPSVSERQPAGNGNISAHALIVVCRRMRGGFLAVARTDAAPATNQRAQSLRRIDCTTRWNDRWYP